MNTPSPGAALRELRDAISRSRGAIAEGAFIDLSGLDAEVARILEAASHAPDEDRPGLLVDIEALLRELDSLAVLLRRQHDAARAHYAAEAYGAE